MLTKVEGRVTFQRKTLWSIHLIWTGFQVHGRNSRVTEFLNPKCRIRDFPYGPVVKTLLSLQGAWVLSLTGELRSHVPIWHSQKTKKQKQNPNSNNKRNITETKIPKYRIKDNNQRIGQELRSQLWTETLQFAESAIIMSVLHHFGALSKMSLLFSHQFTPHQA